MFTTLVKCMQQTEGDWTVVRCLASEIKMHVCSNASWLFLLHVILVTVAYH